MFIDNVVFAGVLTVSLMICMKFRWWQSDER